MAEATKQEAPNLYQRLLSIAAQLEVQKGGKMVPYQPNQPKYAYLKYDDLVRALKPLFVNNGVAWFVNYEDTTVESALTSQQKSTWRAQTTCVLTLVNADKPEECIVLRAVNIADDSGDKGINKAQTSALKGLLSKLFLAPGEEETDDVASGDERHSAVAPPRRMPAPKAPIPTPKDELLAAIGEIFRSLEESAPHDRFDVFKKEGWEKGTAFKEWLPAQDLETLTRVRTGLLGLKVEIPF